MLPTPREAPLRKGGRIEASDRYKKRLKKNVTLGKKKSERQWLATQNRNETETGNRIVKSFRYGRRTTFKYPMLLGIGKAHKDLETYK